MLHVQRFSLKAFLVLEKNTFFYLSLYFFYCTYTGTCSALAKTFELIISQYPFDRIGPYDQLVERSLWKSRIKII